MHLASQTAILSVSPRALSFGKAQSLGYVFYRDTAAFVRGCQERSSIYSEPIPRAKPIHAKRGLACVPRNQEPSPTPARLLGFRVP
jgi:hypothetical protein